MPAEKLLVDKAELLTDPTAPMACAKGPVRRRAGIGQSIGIIYSLRRKDLF
jgi:hypothetical protein